MRRDVTIASGDYTSTASVTELSFTPGKYSLKRILATFDGNAAAVTFAVYVAASGLTAATLTAAIRAAGEVYFDSAVAAAATPSPEINTAGDPIACDVRAGESVYVYVLTGNNPVSGTVRLFL